MPLRRRLILLAGVLILAIFFRTYRLATVPPGLYPDEALNGTNALRAIRTGQWSVFYPENGGREGLFINLQGLALKGAGVREPWVLRSVSAVFGILTVLGIYLLGAEMFGAEIALVAAYFAATGFWHVNFSRIGLRAISAPFWLTWALYFLWLADRKLRAQAALWKVAAISVAGGACFGLGFHSYIAYRVSPPLIFGVMAWLGWRSREERKNWAIVPVTYLSAAALAAAPLLFYFLRNPGAFSERALDISVFASGHVLANLARNALLTAQMLFVMGDLNWRHNLSGQPELVAPVAILFAAGVLLCARNLTRDPAGKRSPPACAIVLAWLVVGALPAVLSNENLPHAMRSLLMIPPVYLAAALAAVEIHAWAHRAPRLGWSVAILVLVFAAGYGFWEYFIAWAGSSRTAEAFSASSTDAGHRINALRAAGDRRPVYVVVPGDPVLIEGIPLPAQPVMFLTGTENAAPREAADIHYVVVGREKEIPDGAAVFRLERDKP